MAKNLEVTLVVKSSACKEACETLKAAHDAGDRRAIRRSTEKLREVVRANTSIVGRSKA